MPNILPTSTNDESVAQDLQPTHLMSSGSNDLINRNQGNLLINEFTSRDDAEYQAINDDDGHLQMKNIAQQILELNKLARFDNYNPVTQRSLKSQLHHQFNFGNAPMRSAKPLPAAQVRVNNKDLNQEFNPVSSKRQVKQVIFNPVQTHQRALKGKVLKQSHRNFLFPEQRQGRK